MRGRSQPARRRLAATIALAVSALTLVGVGVFGMLSSAAPPAGTTLDMTDNRVRVDPASSPSPAVEKAMRATTEPGTRFVVPSVGLNVPLGALDAVDGEVTPPGFASAYRIRNEGVALTDPSKGTVFVVMHSLRGGGVAPGNFLIDVDKQRAKVSPGATITVGGLHYRVTGSQAIAKSALSSDAQVWANIPNRLVVITCLQVSAGTASVDNMVITAVRQP